MPFEVRDPKRVGQAQYWTFFVLNGVAIVVLLVGGLWALFSGELVLGMLMILAVIPVGIYFRVIQMRRCRDIGWPAFLPWVFFGMQFLNGLRFDLQEPTSMGLGLPIVLGLADFIFSIAIGALPSRQGFDPESGLAAYAPATQAPGVTVRSSASEKEFGQMASGATYSEDRDDQMSREDAAIARALAAHRSGQSLLADPPQARQQGQQPAVPGIRRGGFGKKGL